MQVSAMNDHAPRHNLLEVENLRIGFRTLGVLNEVVKGVSFRIEPGKTVALVGESGSGKSVISQAIMGLLHRNGEILGGHIRFRDPARPEATLDIAGLDRNGAAIRALRGGRIGMIFQEPMSSLSPIHTIGDQIGEAYMLHTPEAAREPVRKVVCEMLRRVGFKNPDNAFDQYPFELSGGLRQRAMLAMALICRPALLIADEPTTALDVTIQAQVLGLMRELQQDLGMAILLITHDLGVVANMADEVVVVYHGDVMEAGTTEDVFRNPRHPYLSALFRALPHFSMQEGERLQALRSIERPAAAPKAERMAPASDRPLLDVRNVTKSYGAQSSGLMKTASRGGEILAVNDVSLTIAPGECLGLVGESGCGKTTLSKVIMRAIAPTRGTMLYHKDGQDIDIGALQGDALRAFRPRMQMIFQDPASSLSPRMTVRDILREPLDIHNMGDDAGRDQIVADLMRHVGLDPRFLNRYPHSFSGGQRQRIGIARALALSPDLVVCDEPVSALDVSVQAQVLNLLKDLADERGLAYLFISHNLAVVKYMADRIAVMANGRIVETAPSATLFERPVHAYTKALRKAVPYADLDRLMDFKALPSQSASDMAHWPPAFQHHGQPDDLAFLDLGEGHFVLANKAADRRELMA